jgi:hypothetical protein
MRTHQLVCAAALGGLITLAAGCNKQETASPPVVSPQTETKVTPAAVEAVKTTATQAVQAATTSVKAVAEQVSSDTAKAQGLIDAANKQVAEGKWQEVTGTLAQLKDLKLTPAQETALQDLKAKLEKMVQENMTKKAAPAVGNLIPK